MIEISEIQIIPIKPKKGLVAFASVVINNQFYIGNIGVYSSPTTDDGFRLVYPDKILPNGKRIHCVHPINKEAAGIIHKAIVSEYQKLMENVGRRSERVNTFS